jgi:hypothetical protein
MASKKSKVSTSSALDQMEEWTTFISTAEQQIENLVGAGVIPDQASASGGVRLPARSSPRRGSRT